MSFAEISSENFNFEI